MFIKTQYAGYWRIVNTDRIESVQLNRVNNRGCTLRFIGGEELACDESVNEMGELLKAYSPSAAL